jgi:osmotically inducible protein OsmC
MALAFQLQGAGFTPTELSTECAISFEKEPEGQGFRIAKSALTLRGNVPNIDRQKFEELARVAEKNCPVSKVLKAEITMDFTLA